MEELSSVPDVWLLSGAITPAREHLRITGSEVRNDIKSQPGILQISIDLMFAEVNGSPDHRP